MISTLDNKIEYGGLFSTQDFRRMLATMRIPLHCDHPFRTIVTTHSAAL